jgi:23S rRNA (cytosine1962-C5)-methyltransferase
MSLLTPDQYQLLDFGQGRKLERFGTYVLDRPAPAAEGPLPARSPADWQKAHARFERTSAESGRWIWKEHPRQPWTVTHDAITFQLKPTEFGHLGVFPEQVENWDWISRRVRQTERALRVLNLFAYTGGSTLTAAAAGAEVTHVDAARNVVAWARRNAELSGLHDAPIRWIVEDAPTFVARELRRGNRYDAVILDPPSYGHGPKGRPWKLTSDLAALLKVCAEIVENSPAMLLLTCHTAGYGCAELEALVSEAFFGACQQGVVSKTLFLTATDGRRLPCGVCARWPA